MGLSCSQCRLLMLTRRKSDIELRMNFDSMQKMALARESANLSKEYYGKLQTKKVSYYDNGSYKDINYNYLMGYGVNYTPITNGTRALKSNNNMVLTDYTGKVVLSDSYRNAIVNSLGSSYQEGDVFNLTTDNLAEILSNICNAYSKNDFKAVLENCYSSSSDTRKTYTGSLRFDEIFNGDINIYKKDEEFTPKDINSVSFLQQKSNVFSTSYNTTKINTEALPSQNVFNDYNTSFSSSYDATRTFSGSQEEIGDVTVDNTDSRLEKIQKIIDFYTPIFQAAATNGWTTAYNQEIADNEHYVSDALVSGIFALESIDYTGNYDEGTSLEYYITSGYVEESSLSTAEREEIQTWYNNMLADINEKESWLDLDLQNLNTELNAVNTDIQSTDSFIKDALKMFEWGGK